MSAERELIHAIQETLETLGWIQRMAVSAEGFCIGGALEFNAKDGETLTKCWRALNAATAPHSFTQWNDTPGRTYEEVIWLLKEVENTLP